jgi:hypothetical protein
MNVLNWFARHMPAALVFATMLLLPANADAPGDNDTLNVVLDHATLVKLPDRVATVVVGNPMIADVSLQPAGMVVVTGKGFGTTNLMALDRGGAMLLEKTVVVRASAANTVTLYRGILRETYNCAPKCEQTVTPGDSPQFFSNIFTQVGSRANQAQGSTR